MRVTPFRILPSPFLTARAASPSHRVGAWKARRKVSCVAGTRGTAWMEAVEERRTMEAIERRARTPEELASRVQNPISTGALAIVFELSCTCRMGAAWQRHALKAA
jgi:hypothetical protein